MTTDAQHCRIMIRREEQRALDAPSPEAAESHHQLAMLYRVQLHILENSLRIPFMPERPLHE